MFRHSHYLRAAMNLAADRDQQLARTAQKLGVPLANLHGDELTRVQLQTAKEIGGVWTRMLLDAPEEVMKYHFAPLQIALCLLYAIIERYQAWSRLYPAFRDKDLDEYCQENEAFLQQLKKLRDSLLHQHPANFKAQPTFVGQYGKDMIAVLIEGERTCRNYLSQLEERLAP